MSVRCREILAGIKACFFTFRSQTDFASTPKSVLYTCRDEARGCHRFEVRRVVEDVPLITHYREYVSTAATSSSS